MNFLLFYIIVCGSNFLKVLLFERQRDRSRDKSSVSGSVCKCPQLGVGHAEGVGPRPVGLWVGARA